MTFEVALQHTLDLEQGYVNHPNDRGGPTNFGITEVVARAYGYKHDMKDMPLSVAKQIYKKRYWDTLNLDAISKVSEKVAHKVFDQSVNLGVGWAGQTFQRVLNVLNRQTRDYGDLTVDGQLGAVSVAAFNKYMSVRKVPGEQVFLTALEGLQTARYIGIAESNPSQEVFVFGWILNRVVGVK